MKVERKVDPLLLYSSVALKCFFSQIFEKCENTGGYVNHKFTVFINVTSKPTTRLKIDASWQLDVMKLSALNVINKIAKIPTKPQNFEKLFLTIQKAKRSNQNNVFNKTVFTFQGV